MQSKAKTVAEYLAPLPDDRRRALEAVRKVILDNLDSGYEDWAKSGRRLDMGKACIRFRTLEDLPLDVIGEAIRRLPASVYIEAYESGRRKR